MNGKMKSKFNVTVELFQVLGQFFETVSFSGANTEKAVTVKSFIKVKSCSGFFHETRERHF